MATLQLTFSDLYQRVAEFLGLTTYSVAPTSTNLTMVKDIVYRGYRQFLIPINVSTGKLHRWSFLYKHDILKTTADKWIYELPPDFANEVLFFEHDTDTSYSRPTSKNYKDILRFRALSDSSSYPSCFAVRTGRYDKEVGQRYEVVFYETPNGVYTLPYCYIFDPIKPDTTTDYLVGGVRASEAILESCLAIAELQEDDTVGNHAAKAEELIQKLIRQDVPLLADSVGINLDTGVIKTEWSRYLTTLESDTVYYGD